MAAMVIIALTLFGISTRINPVPDVGKDSLLKNKQIVIRGYVKDLITAQIMRGAKIFLYDNQKKLIQSKLTDSKGYFNLATDFIDGQEMIVQVSKNGYDDNTQTRTFPNEGTYYLPDIMIQKPGAEGIRPEDAKKGTAIREPTEAPVEVNPNETPEIKMCTAICDTRGIKGVEVSFRDPKSNKKYTGISSGNDLEFQVPCFLLESKESVEVTFKRNDTSDYANVRLRRFEISERVFK